MISNFNVYADFRVLKEKIKGSKITYYDMDDDEIIDYVIEETKDFTISFWKEDNNLHKVITTVNHRKMIEETYVLNPGEKNFKLISRLTQIPFGENYSKDTIEYIDPQGNWVIEEKLIKAKQANEFAPLKFLFDFNDNVSLEERVVKKSGMCLDSVLAAANVSVLEGKGFGNLQNIVKKFFEKPDPLEHFELINCGRTNNKYSPPLSNEQLIAHKRLGGTSEGNNPKRQTQSSICPGPSNNNCQYDPNKNMEELVKDSLNRGIKCLSKINKSLAVRLLAVTQGHIKGKKMKVQCTENGSTDLGIATLPCVKTWPGVKLTRPGHYVVSKTPPVCMCTSEENFKSTLFHEMIHTLGYPHSSVPDLATICEAACFDKTSLSTEPTPLSPNEQNKLRKIKAQCNTRNMNGNLSLSEKKEYWGQYIDSLSEQQNPSSSLPSYFKGFQYYWMNGEYDEEVIIQIIEKMISHKNSEQRPGEIFTSEKDLISVYMFLSPRNTNQAFENYVQNYANTTSHLTPQVLTKIKELGEMYRSGDRNEWLKQVNQLPTNIRGNFSQLLSSHCKKHYFDSIKNIEDEELKEEVTQICKDRLSF